MTKELDYIDQYFSGSMPEQEKLVFENRIQTDTDFAEEVAFYLSTLTVTREHLDQDKKDRFRRLYNSTNEKVVVMGRVIPWLKPLIAAALLIMVFLAWIFFLQQSSVSQLADSYIKGHFYQLGVHMGTENNPIEDGKALFNKGKLNEAGKIFENVLSETPENGEALLLAGIVSLRLENYDKAIDYFRKLADHPGLYTNPGHFYEAVVLMKRDLPGDKIKAKQLLQTVVQQNLDEKELAAQWLDKFD